MTESDAEQIAQDLEDIATRVSGSDELDNPQSLAEAVELIAGLIRSDSNGAVEAMKDAFGKVFEDNE